MSARQLADLDALTVRLRDGVDAWCRQLTAALASNRERHHNSPAGRDPQTTPPQGPARLLQPVQPGLSRGRAVPAE